MSIEELLKPRVKVIAPMPLMKNKVGEFLYRQEDDKGNIWFGISAGKEMHFFKLEDFREWSNIFHICEWWEERKESEMPEYVKDLYDQEPFKIVSKHPISKDEYLITNRPKPAHYAHIKHFLPATEEEYIQYQQNKNVCQ
jgi:hypothetical protein